MLLDFFFGVFMCILAIGLVSSMSGPSKESVQSAAEELARIIKTIDDHNKELEQRIDVLEAKLENLYVDRPAH